MLFARHTRREDLTCWTFRTMITTHVICCSHLQGQRAQPPKTLNASSKSPKRLSGSVGFNKHRNRLKNTTVSIMWSLINPPEPWIFIEYSWRSEPLIFGTLVNRPLGRPCVLRLYAACAWYARPTGTWAKVFHTHRTRVQRVVVNTRGANEWQSWVLGGVYEGHIIEEWMNYLWSFDWPKFVNQQMIKWMHETLRFLCSFVIHCDCDSRFDVANRRSKF